MSTAAILQRRDVAMLVALVAAILTPSVSLRAREPKESASAEAAKKKGAVDFSGAIRAILEKAPRELSVGVVVIDAEGKTRFSENAEKPLAPASNQKILVVGTALGLLGPGFQYQTTLSARAAPVDGAVADLVVRGDGDPNISGRFHNGDSTAVFRAWAAELKKAGVKRISGDLVVDDSQFDAQRFLPGWKESQAGSYYSAEVSALNLNDNCIEVIVRPSSAGQLAKVELRPATAYISVENQCKTVAAVAKARPIILRKPRSNSITVRDGISVKGKEYSDPVPVEDPSLYFGTVLAEVLKAEGIAVEGKVARGKLEERAGPSPFTLHRHSSSLAEDLPVINKKSQNLHAEILLKTLGAHLENEGSVEGGSRAVEKFLKKEGLPSSGLRVADGSGLSAGNRVAPGTIAAILAWIQRQPFARQYLESLPVAGKDGTLKKRFHARKALGHVFAKTGYIAGVSSLSGYVERGGKQWVFSILVNGLRGGAHKSTDITAARSLQEEIAEVIYTSMAE